MRILDDIQDIISSNKNLRLTYQSGYTTGTRDWLECPCCGSTIPYDSDYNMKDVTHQSDCLYYLVTKLEKAISNDSVKQLLNNIKVEDESN